MRTVGLFSIALLLAAAIWLGVRSSSVGTDGSFESAGTPVQPPDDSSATGNGAERAALRTGEGGISAAPSAEAGAVDSTSATLGGDEVAAAEGRTWPVEPEVMHNIVLAEMGKFFDTGLINVLSSNCSPTACEVRLVATRLSALSGKDFPGLLARPPYEATFKLESRLQRTGADEVTFTFYAGTPPPPTAEEVADRMRSDAESTRYFAANALPSGSYGSQAVRFGSRGGAEQFVEDICSVDCPLDGRRVIYLDVPDGGSCDEFEGIEQSFNVRSSTGSFSERTFCVPRFLIEYPAD